MNEQPVATFSHVKNVAGQAPRYARSENYRPSFFLFQLVSILSIKLHKLRKEISLASEVARKVEPLHPPAALTFCIDSTADADNRKRIQL